MQGIPVLESGDPLRVTRVIAGNYQQFGNWCRYSQVNPRSGMVRYVSNEFNIRGLIDFDVVYTGLYAERRDFERIYEAVSCYNDAGRIGRIYRQFESADIEPNIVRLNTITVIR
jgi:hypothetical protein